MSKHQPDCDCGARVGQVHAKTCGSRAKPAPTWPLIDGYCVNHGATRCPLCTGVVGEYDSSTGTVTDPRTGETTAWSPGGEG